MIIGLTGNIGCGKSVASKILAKLGACVVDADAVSKELTDESNPENFNLLAEIQSKLGTSDRVKLREKVFSDPAQKRQLEKILHPKIRAQVMKKISDAVKSGKKLVIYEAPLLIEAGIPKELNGILLITCDPAIQQRRILERDRSLTPELVGKIMNSQLSQNEKIKKSKWIIDNSFDLSKFESELTQWFNRIMIASSK